jgi:hypothetical protein
MMPVDQKAGVIVAGGAAWLVSFASAAHHSLATPTGEAQLAEHLPLLIVLAGGIGGLWVGVSKVIGLYKAGIEQVRAIVKDELATHAAREQSVMADVLRRVAHVERMVDARGRPPSRPFAVPRQADPEPGVLRDIANPTPKKDR